MPQFKIRYVDGRERTFAATRMVTHHDRTVFHGRGATDPVVHQISSDEIADIRRRIVEPSGTARWITERHTADTQERT